MIRRRRIAREKLWRRRAMVKTIRPSVKLDLIFLYISTYETRSTSSRTRFPAVI